MGSYGLAIPSLSSQMIYIGIRYGSGKRWPCKWWPIPQPAQRLYLPSASCQLLSGQRKAQIASRGLVLSPAHKNWRKLNAAGKGPSSRRTGFRDGSLFLLLQLFSVCTRSVPSSTSCSCILSKLKKGGKAFLNLYYWISAGHWNIFEVNGELWIVCFKYHRKKIHWNN